MRKIWVLAGAACMLGLSACGKNLVTIQDYADAASAELGVAVVIQGDNNDECARLQLGSLYNEYRALNETAKTALKTKLASYKSIVIKRTADVGTVQGHHSFLQMVEEGYCFTSGGSAYRCWKTQTSKSLIDTRTVLKAETEVKKGEPLEIRAQSYMDRSSFRNYMVKDRALYELVVGEDEDPVFVTGLRYRTIWLEEESDRPQLRCGTFAKVADLI